MRPDQWVGELRKVIEDRLGRRKIIKVMGQDFWLKKMNPGHARHRTGLMWRKRK